MKRTVIPRWRIVCATAVIVTFWAVGLLRLVQVQILSHAEAQRVSQRQAQGWVDIPADRGRIYDRHGTLLASSRSCESFAAVPRQWESRSERVRAARRLASISGRSSKEWLRRFKQSPQFVYVARAVDERTRSKLEGYGDPAIFSLTEPGRHYSAGPVGRELIGCVNIDNRGAAGIELAYDDVLAGRPARGRVRYDARRATSLDPLPASLALDGSDLVLTVDWRWQEIVEQELHKAIRATRALGGGAIFMTPRGAVRALAYRVNDSLHVGNSTSARCRPITDLFEPGSTFKAFIASALLSENKVKLADTVYADSGVAYFADRRIRDSEPHLWLSFAQSLIVSSNIAFGKWAQRIEGPDWYRWIRDFGFGEATPVSLPAQPDGIVPNPKRWTDLAIAQLAMGHSVAVTPLQLVTAFAAFANGGDLYRPYVVGRIIDHAGDTVLNQAPKRVRHLLDPSVVETMGKLLARVVSEGTAKQSQSKAITLAGKTGTAQKVREDGGGYYQDRFVASFVGYFPADAPQVVGVVYLDEPRTIHFGGWTAGPVFRSIAERLAAMHPELLNYPLVDAAGTLPPARSEPELVQGVVPDFFGLPLASAVACAAELGYRVHTDGSGCVYAQSPAAGSRLAAGAQIELVALRGAERPRQREART